MGKGTNKLTDRKVQSLKAPGRYGDGLGLWLQIGPEGGKSWIYRYMLDGKARMMGLGRYPDFSLTEARDRATEYRKLLKEKKDPIEERDAKHTLARLARSKVLTFDQCATAYINAHRSSWKSAKHASQWENTLKTHVGPVIGALPVALVDTAMVMKVLGPIWNTTTVTANRVRARIESVLDWATVSNYRQGDNPARWRGHLENLLAQPKKVAKIEHHPALPWQEIGAFMAALREQVGIDARAVEFAILTAARSGEVTGATWDEIDLGAALWTIPAERMKKEREHRVPLSTAAIVLLKALARTSDLVFPGARRGRKLTDLTRVLERLNHGAITVHGFRSTFRDWCAESVANSFPREVCEHALAHSLPDKTEAAYRRGDLIEKRTLLMQAWADYCAKIPTAANVTPIRGETAA
jgi:integrase